MTTPAPWCCVAVELTAEELITLDALDGDNEVQAVVTCEIQEGHDGPHMALGQACNPDEWWLLWDGASVRDLRVLPQCEAEDAESGYVCVLPLDHPGRHGFTLD